MKYRFLGLCFLACLIGHNIFAQLDNNYRPLKLTGKIPEDMLTQVKSQTLLEMSKAANVLDKKQGKTFYALSNYAFTQAMQSGKVYFNDEFSAYLESIVDRLLKDDPELRSKIRIYSTRISVPNASAWRNGVIFFNIPLFSYMESEAEIAFILAHEIVHFQEEHTLQRFTKSQDLKNPGLEKAKDADKLFELLRFSRENELEADKQAFQMLLKTNYDPAEALSALFRLKEINASSTVIKQDLPNLFQLDVDSVIFDSGCDPERFVKAEDAENAEHQENDSLSTHPNIDVRISIIEKDLNELSVNKGGVRFIQSEEVFELIREKAYIEQIHNWYTKRAFTPALYGSLRLAYYYPGNRFLQETAVKSVFWICKYTAEGEKEIAIPPNDAVMGSFGYFCCFLNQLSPRDRKSLYGEFVKDRSRKFPDSEEISVYAAKTLQKLEMNQDAKNHYENYLDSFPQGKYTEYVRQQLEKLAAEKHGE